MKNKKFLLKLIFVLVLIAAILYTFRDSAGPIVREIRVTAPWVLAAICISSIVYHLFEGWITYSLAKQYNPRFRYFSAVGCAFYCSFYRVATLGSGSGVAAIYYLGKHNVEYSHGTGLYMVQYMMHKVSIAIFSGLFFLINWHVMIGHFKKYGVYLLLAYAVTVVIVIALLLVACTTKLNGILFLLTGLLKKSEKMKDKMESLEEKCIIMQTSTAELLHVRGLIFSMIIKNLIKVCFWYAIPFLIVLGKVDLTLLDSLSITSLSVMAAAVIPTPAGIGSTEFIMTALYQVVMGVELAGTTTLLYRFATFVFPFVVGGVMIFFMRRMERRKAGYNNANEGEA